MESYYFRGLHGALSLLSCYTARSCYLKYKSADPKTKEEEEEEKYNKITYIKHTGMALVCGSYVPPLPKNPFLRNSFENIRFAASVFCIGCFFYGVENIVQRFETPQKEQP